ncbi:hypothetical protein GCM10010885_19520 [Alicyclobacillus cellulosilyticus]|uniref:Uncharacterized protein n=1 Tax=Alicyclobacillus cellulosilyticus TaxID=1003997 RepID=A0A917KHT2_9BACL|nr:hypothetical protein GCM10010885_19520 [Alicyclobacillus cellulosilyticus]
MNKVFHLIAIYLVLILFGKLIIHLVTFLLTKFAKREINYARNVAQFTVLTVILFLGLLYFMQILT